MKILPIINNEKNHLINTTYKIKELSKQGYDIANRTAGIYKKNKLQKYCGITRSVANKMWKHSTINDLPYIAGALGLFVPIPLVSPIAMGMGFILKFLFPHSSESIKTTKNTDKLI